MTLYANKPTVFFKDGTSLGDVFVINGLIHHAAKDAEQLFYFCDPGYFETVNCLYQDHPNIHIISDLEEWNHQRYYVASAPIDIVRWEYVTTEISLERAHFVNWERQIYEWCELPFSMRYKNFKLPKHIKGAEELKQKLTGGEEDYVVIHQQMGVAVDTRVEYNINHLNPKGYKVVEIVPGITNNLLQYVPLLKGAKQIHVLPSSVHALVDGFATECIAEGMYLHDLRKSWFSQLNCKWNDYRWTKIHYEVKF
jgi:hypothetical protein